MTRFKSEVLRDIEQFASDDGNWPRLDDLLTQLWSAGVQQQDLPTLFGIFERFPKEDGNGVLWDIVHGVESLGFDYEPLLRASLNRRHSFMGRIMLDRLERVRK